MSRGGVRRPLRQPRRRRGGLRLHPGGGHAGGADAAGHARPRRVLEVGTALGHMTANLTGGRPTTPRSSAWASSRAWPAAPGAAEQQVEGRTRGEFGRFADHFGKAHKALFITADSMRYDFGRLAPLDFAFIDGGHDLEHALNDSRKAYEALAPGGWLVWHDFNSPVPWVKVREAIERLGFAEPVVHVEGTEVAFLRKQAPLPAPRTVPCRSRPGARGLGGGLRGAALAGAGQPGAVPRAAGAGPRPGPDLGSTGRGGTRRPSGCRSSPGWRRGWVAGRKGGRRRCTCGTSGRRGSSRRRTGAGC